MESRPLKNRKDGRLEKGMILGEQGRVNENGEQRRTGGAVKLSKLVNFGVRR